MRAVHSFFREGTIPKAVNSSFIPKVENPYNCGQFSPHKSLQFSL